MAKALTPLRVEIDCVFQCPSCNTETWHTLRELQHRKRLNCPCGTKTRIEPVSSVEVVYAGKAVGAFDGSGQQAGPVFPVDDFVSTLVALGYKTAEARKLVETHKDTHDGDDGKFITFLLTQGVSA
jgi:hypothetical protein